MSHYYEEFSLRIVAWAGNGKPRKLREQRNNDGKSNWY